MDAKKHKCKYCKKLFERPSDLKRHYRIHTGEKAFACDVCEKSFSQSGNLLVHKLIHAGKNSHECNVCNKMFSQKCSLVRHKRTHTGETPFVCGKCGKAFSNPYHLVCHYRTHSGLKPYKCPTCGKKFSQCSGLISHKRIHTGEKLFKCNICGKEYSQASGLQKHKRTHSGEIFSCNICNQQFSKASNLMKHKITHNGGKYFDCHVQIRDVLPAKNLLDHKGTHPGVNLFKFDIRVKVTKESHSDLLNETTPALSQKQSYPCELCEQHFASSELLTLHKEFHTSQQISSVVSPAPEQLECHLDIELEDNRSPQTAAMNREESYQCDLRERVFASSELLTLHKESIHIGQQMDDVVSHEQVQHNLNNELGADKELVDNSSHQATSAMSQEESYRYDLCEKGFASSELLTLHKVSHTGQQMDNVVSHEQVEHRPNNGLEVKEGSIDNASYQTAPSMPSQEESYQCDLCKIIFESSELLTLHKEFHTRRQISSVVSPAPKQLECCLDIELGANMNQEESYQCDLCERVFASSELLTLHKESIHIGQQMDDVAYHEQVQHNLNNELEADRVQLVDNSSHQATSAMSHEESYKCDLCEKGFASSELLTLHKVSHTGQEMDNVVSHEQVEHRPNNGLEVNEGSIDNASHQTAPAMSQEESYQCDLCKIFFESSELLTLHKEFHTRRQISSVVSPAPKQLECCLDIELEANMNREESYQCELCERVFASSELLTLHKESIHIGQQMDDVVSHEQVQHNLNNELEADKELVDNSSHQATSAMSHEESYKCDLCEKGFASSELLTLHKVSHTGQEMDNVVSHEQVEHRPNNGLEVNEGSIDNASHQTAPAMSQEESNQCDLCKIIFESSELLTLHKESHTGQEMDNVVSHKQVECNLNNGHETDRESFDNRLPQTTPDELCERVFTSSELLTLHREFHTGQQIMNDFVSHLQLEYYLDNGLEANEEPFDNRSHQTAQTMSQEESYQCDLCEKVFASSELLTLHKEFHTEQQIMNDVVSHEQVEYHLEANKESFDNRSHQTLPSMSQEESYQCDLCKRIFESSQHLTLHKEFHHTLPQISDAVSLNQSECHLDNNELQGNEDPFGNRSHQTPLSVGQEESHECDLSEIILASLQLLALQKESIHTGQQMNNLVPYEQLEYQLDNELEDNEKSFGGRLYHRAPAMMVKKEPYQCNLCERNFVSSGLLTLHGEFHTGQQISDVVYHEQLYYHLDNELDATEPSGITYICADCDEEFELAGELLKHSEMAHAI